MIFIGDCLMLGRSYLQHTHRKRMPLHFITLIAVCFVANLSAVAKSTQQHPSPKTVKVAAVQYSSKMGSVASGTRKVTKLVREAARNGAKIVEWLYHILPGQVHDDFRHHIIAANWSVDHAQKWRGFGFSEIISREGKVLSVAKSIFGSEIVYADLPMAKR